MQKDEPLLGGDVRRRPSALDARAAELFGMRETQQSARLRHVQVPELLTNDLDAPARSGLQICPIAQIQLVPEIGDGRFRRLSVLVLPFGGNDHLCPQKDRLRGRAAVATEDPTYVPHAACSATHFERCLQERSLRQRRQERDRVEDVGLPHPVRTRDAREWAELNVDVQVLEATRHQTGQHAPRRTAAGAEPQPPQGAAGSFRRRTEGPGRQQGNGDSPEGARDDHPQLERRAPELVSPPATPTCPWALRGPDPRPRRPRCRRPPRPPPPIRCPPRGGSRAAAAARAA
jgi:hypothetical protein